MTPWLQAIQVYPAVLFGVGNVADQNELTVLTLFVMDGQNVADTP